MSLLAATRLYREYSRAGKVFAAVDGVSLSMDKGEAVSIVGRSGGGKTTLLGMVAGLISPTGGEIVLDGQFVSARDDAAASRLRNRVVGYVPQGSSLLPALTALDNVRLPHYLGRAERPGDCADRALALMEAMGAAHLRDAYPADLSGGELRRVAIARALINAPKLLIADEPTSDLDEESAAEVMRLLARVNAEGTALLLATHDRDLAALTARTLTMAAGKLRRTDL
jgi:putative ABC transport system ATP-binding protein